MRRIARELGENLTDDELRVSAGCCCGAKYALLACLAAPPPVLLPPHVSIGPPDAPQAMIDEFDRDLDGEINEDEFVYIMKQTTIY